MSQDSRRRPITHTKSSIHLDAKQSVTRIPSRSYLPEQPQIQSCKLQFTHVPIYRPSIPCLPLFTYLFPCSVSGRTAPSSPFMKSTRHRAFSPNPSSAHSAAVMSWWAGAVTEFLRSRRASRKKGNEVGIYASERVNLVFAFKLA